MCGIGGFIAKKTSFEGKDFLAHCGVCMAERGPDQFGEFIKDNVGFIHKRLSIIDLSESGRQPMSDETGKYVITYNGEIYNYKELKKELLVAGRHFTTESDTEVIIQGYKTWGSKKLLEKLDGMFAFALVDFEKNVIVLARDIFGKKPLYYYQDDACFLFSSDIRAIHAKVKGNLSLDLESIDYYLSELSVPQPKTIWKEVKQLQPASYMELYLHDFNVQERDYFQLSNNVSPSHLSLEEAIEETEVLLKAAILKRLVADVPVGCFLSGGVDSGLIVSILASATSEKVKTFSIGFDGEDNELPDARIVADRYQTDHHEIIITPSIIEDLPNLIRYVGEPFADSSLLPSFYVCKAMRGELKVVLSGDGGDELFGGYPQYVQAYKSDQFMRKHRVNASAFLAAQGDKFVARIQGRKENAGAYWHYSQLDAPRRLSREIGFAEDEKRQLYSANFKQSVSFYNSYMNSIWESQTTLSNVNTLMRSSLQTRLLNDYLVKVDRASMINSLEVRSPLLDKELAKFAFSLPDQYKFHNAQSKYILKKLASKYFDPEIFNKRKRGFSFPLAKWLEIGFKERLNSLKGNDASIYKTELFSQEEVVQVITRYNKGNVEAVNKVWILLCLDEWCNHFL